MKITSPYFLQEAGAKGSEPFPYSSDQIAIFALNNSASFKIVGDGTITYSHLYEGEKTINVSGSYDFSQNSVISANIPIIIEGSFSELSLYNHDEIYYIVAKEIYVGNDMGLQTVDLSDTKENNKFELLWLEGDGATTDLKITESTDTIKVFDDVLDDESKITLKNTIINKFHKEIIGSGNEFHSAQDLKII